LLAASMTEEFKKRICETLRDLEQIPRRIYSEILGYSNFLSVAQLSVLIRCAFRCDNEIQDVRRVDADEIVTKFSTEKRE
jgi:para-aminobenzoate synthetase